MKKILIAEDNEEIQNIYDIWLNDHYDKTQVYNGQEAIEKYLEYKPDLTLMDINMPVLRGDKAITRIFEHDSNANIIAVTAYNYTEKELGVPVYRKGFKKDEFLEMVEAGLKGEFVSKSGGWDG